MICNLKFISKYQYRFTFCQMQLQQPQNKICIEKILNLIEKKEDIKQTNQCVLFMGMTGAGKSTLINLLLNKKMRIIMVNQRVMLELLDQQYGAKIGNTYNAQTIFPKLFRDQIYDINYCDCPGFLDTKGVEYDIANAIYIQHLFKKIKKVKIVLVIGSQQLQGRAIHFVQKIQKMYRMIPNFGLIKKSLALVITKATKSQQLYASDLRNILKSRQEYFNDQQFKQYFGQLVKKCTPLIVKRPNHEDQIQQSDQIQTIRQSIRQLDYAEGIQVQEIPISAESQKVLFQLTHQYQIYLNLRLSKWVDQIDQFCSLQSNKVGLFFKLKDARAYLKLIEVLPKNISIQNNFKKLQSTIKKFMIILKIRTEILSILEILKFCFDTKSFTSDAQDSQLQFLKLTSIQLCILQYLRDIKKNIIFQISKKLENTQPLFGQLIDKSSIEDLQKIRVNIKDVLQIKKQDIFFKVYHKILSFNIQIDQINVIIQESQKQSTNLNKNEVPMKEDSLIKLVNQLYKNRDPQFSLQYQVFIILKNFFARKSQQIHKIIIERLKKTNNSSQNQALKKRIRQMEDSRSSRLQMIKNSKIIFEGRRNGLFLKGHIISLAIITNQIYQHISEQLFQSKKVNTSKLTPKKQQKGTFFSIGSSDRSDKVKGAQQIQKKRNFFMKQEYLTIGFYCFVFAGSEIYIDDDFRAYCNMLFVAPKIVIRKNKYGERPILTLKGLDGDIITQNAPAKRVANKHDFDVSQRQDYRIRGINGQQGNPGYPGANITLVARQFEGLQNLTIDLSGGNGNDGQNGGDGADCNFTFITRPKKGHGGDGGTGGKGGAKGTLGFFSIYDHLGNPIQKSKVRLIGRQGNPGKPGKGGQGGHPWDKGKKEDKKKFKYGRTGEDGGISEEYQKYSNLVLRQCEFEYLRSSYNRDFYVIYKGTDHQNFLQQHKNRNLEN